MTVENIIENFLPISAPFPISAYGKGRSFYCKDLPASIRNVSVFDFIGLFADIRILAVPCPPCLKEGGPRKRWVDSGIRSMIKAHHKFGVLMLIILSYLLCIPGGIITTVSYLIERLSEHKDYRVTKILCILAIMAGCVFFTAATVKYSHCNEAYYISVPGIIIELFGGL